MKKAVFLLFTMNQIRNRFMVAVNRTSFWFMAAFCFLLSARLSFAAAPQVSVQVSPLILEYTLLPSQSQRDLIVFFNPSSVTQVITPKIYDFIAADEIGGLKFFEDSGWQFSASKWILFEKEQFELLPKEEKTFPIVILVPEEAEPGSHYAAIFGEARPVEEEEIRDPVRVSVRVGAGTLFLINVPDTLGKRDFYSGHIVSFQIRGLAHLPARSSLSLRAHPSESKTGKAGIWDGLAQIIRVPFGFVGGKPLTFIVRFKNTGNFHQRPEGKIEVFNLLGKKTDEILLKKQRVLPGAIIQFKASWKPKFLFGSYLAKLRFSYGKENSLIAESNLKFAAFSPLPLALLLGAIFVILSVFFYRKRKNSSKSNDQILY